MKIVDMHCDTISRLYHARKQGEDTRLRSNGFQLDLERMQRGGYLLQNFAAFVEWRNQDCPPYEECREQIALFWEELAQNAELIAPARTYQEILENEAAGKMSAMLTIEEGEVCGGSLEKLREFYQAGVRMMTFTWNYANTLGVPAEEAVRDSAGAGRTDQNSRSRFIAEAKRRQEGREPMEDRKGLTRTGLAFLEEMERIGMIADVSHLSDQGIAQVCRYAKKPFAASHSNARSLCFRRRNLPDELIRAIAERGGVIGANYYGPFLTNRPDEKGICYGRISDLAAHIRYLADKGGIGCVGLGSDFDGIDDNLELADCSKMERLWQELKKAGWKEHELDAVFFENVLRLYRERL